MVESDTDEALLHGSDDDRLAHYRAVSPLAVVALLLGLASSLALFSPLLWFVPVAAVVTAVAALGRIAASDSALVGRKAAIVGLLLAVFFVSWAGMQRYSRGALLASQARQAADGWWQLVKEGQLDQAHQWMLPVPDRAPPGSDLERFYAEYPEAGSQREDFETKPFIARLAGDPLAQARFLETLAVHQTDDLSVELRYQIEDGDLPPLEADLVMRRFQRGADRHVVWQVARVDEVTGESASR